MFAFSAKAPPKQENDQSDLPDSGRLDELLITHEGYMTELVEGFFGSGWKRQYYVLGKGKLYQYANQQTHKPKNAIDLDGYLVQLIEDRKMLKKLNRQSEVCLFTLSHPDKTKYVFAADSEEDMTEWIEAIMLEMFRDQPIVTHEAPPEARAAEDILNKARQGRDRKATTSSILVVSQNLNEDDEDDPKHKHGAAHNALGGAGARSVSPKHAGAGGGAAAVSGAPAGAVAAAVAAKNTKAKPVPAALDAASIEAQLRAKILREHEEKEKMLKQQIENERRADEERKKQEERKRMERERELEQREKAMRAEMEKMRADLERREQELVKKREQEAEAEQARVEALKAAEIARMEGEAKREAERKERERVIMEKKRAKQLAMEEAARIREERERAAKAEADKIEADRKVREEEEKKRADAEERARIQREKEREERLEAEKKRLEEERVKAEREAERLAKFKEVEYKKQQEEEKARREKEEAEDRAAGVESEKCNNCSKKRLGTEKFCIDCGAQFPDGGKESSEKKRPNLSLPNTPPSPAAAAAAAAASGEKKNFGGGVEGVIAQLDDINKRYESLTMEDAVNGVGTMLYDELKETLTKIKQLRLLLDSVAQYDFNKGMQKTLDELKGCVHLYNRLNKAIPFKVNQFVQKYQNMMATNPESSAAADTCSSCGEKLNGQTVEAVGGFFHMECFKCYGCGTKFQNTCLNIDGKPYCDSCGRKAFVQSKLKAMGAGAAAS